MEAAPFRSLINPDDATFACPENMETAIKAYCQRTNQPVPEERAAITRCIFESLALRYRQVLEQLDSLSGRKAEVLHIIGGGSKNALLNQWTANSIGREVIAGPAEATALGNIMVQALANHVGQNIAELRKLAKKGLELKSFQPADASLWEEAYLKFVEITK